MISTSRFHIGRCTKCRMVIRVDSTGDRSFEGTFGVRCITCRRELDWAPVKGRKTEKACSPKCTGATGNSCECACGGDNHAGAHAA